MWHAFAYPYKSFSRGVSRDGCSLHVEILLDIALGDHRLSFLSTNLDILNIQTSVDALVCVYMDSFIVLGLVYVDSQP